MSRAYREMVERFPQVYGLDDDSQQRWETEQMREEHKRWINDESARVEYESWLQHLRENGL